MLTNGSTDNDRIAAGCSNDSATEQDVNIDDHDGRTTAPIDYDDGPAGR